MSESRCVISDLILSNHLVFFAICSSKSDFLQARYFCLDLVEDIHVSTLDNTCQEGMKEWLSNIKCLALIIQHNFNVLSLNGK